MEIMEPQIRQLYRILGHAEGDGYSDVRCIIPKDSPLEQEKEFKDRLEQFRTKNNREPDDKELATLHVINRSIIKGEQNVLEWAKKYNGRGNCYIGRTARTSDGSLHEFRTITADIDPNRERGTSATPELSARAIQGARKVLLNYPGGYLATSGNGALILYRLPSPITTDFKGFEQRFRLFEDEMRKHLPEGVTLDATFDTARMVKLLGTVSTKGDRANWRVSRFLDFPLMPYLRNDVLGRITACAPALQPTQPATFKNTVYASRSESDFAMALHYKKAGLSKDATREALKQNVLGRKTDYKDQERILYKIFDMGEDAIRPNDEASKELEVSNPEGDKLDDHKRRLLERRNHSTPEMSIGLSVIDKHTWGLRRGEIFTIAARPGIGKTSIAAAIAVRVARTGKRILYFTSEMSVDSTYDRLLQVLSGISGTKFTTGSFEADDRIKLDAAYEELRGFGERLAICDACSPDIEQVKRVANRVTPDLLIYDHIQHIGGSAEGAKANVSKFVRGLKDVARELNCAVLALSQIRRLFKDPKTGKEIRPTLSDLKESGTIEEESGAVLLLSVLSEEPDSSIRCLYSDLAKNRYGPITVVGVEFDKFTAHFKDLEAENIV
jgi:replicative DNA helicase